MMMATQRRYVMEGSVAIGEVRLDECGAEELRTVQSSHFGAGDCGRIRRANQISAQESESRRGFPSRASDTRSSRVAKDRIADPIVRKLKECLLECVEQSDHASRRVVEHIQLALNAHMLHAYGVSTAETTAARGGLAPWQERRAKELIDARLGSEVRLAELAHECELSPRHFARAFKRTTGRSPYQWLLERRIERSQVMLRTSGSPIAEIALMCGFADQSHFTRVFTQTTGMSPRAWQRAHRE